MYDSVLTEKGVVSTEFLGKQLIQSVVSVKGGEWLVPDGFWHLS